jgi:hypothetical protein
VTETKSSAVRKFEWAVKGLNAVRDVTRLYEQTHAYELRVQLKRRSAEQILYRCFARQVKPIPSDLPLLIGDAVQNMRHSLDHLVYTAARGRGKTQFPIFDDPCDFQVMGRRQISTVPKPIRTIIEEVQPYKTIVKRPHTDSLAVLSDLSNHDKHRDIATLASYIDIPWVTSDGPVQFVSSHMGRPLSPDQETEVAAFVVSGPEAHKMKVQTDFSYQVRVERVRRDRRTVDEAPLVTTLENIARRVGNIIEVVEGRQPLSVWLAPAI